MSPDSAHRASLPSLNNNSFNNSYISSDNDSEFEDEDFKLEVSHLREKLVFPKNTSERKQLCYPIKPLFFHFTGLHCFELN